MNIVIEAFGKHSSNLAVSLYKQLQLALFLFLCPPWSRAHPGLMFSCPHPLRQRMSGGLIWISYHEGVSSERTIIVPGMQFSILCSICCLICCVALPSTSQQYSLTMEASVPSEKGVANFLISVVKLELKQLVTPFTHAKPQTTWICS